MSRVRSAKSHSARRTMKASRPWSKRLKPERPDVGRLPGRELAEFSRARLSNAAQRSVPGEMVVGASLVQRADTISRSAAVESAASDLYPLSGCPDTNMAGLR